MSANGSSEAFVLYERRVVAVRTAAAPTWNALTWCRVKGDSLLLERVTEFGELTRCWSTGYSVVPSGDDEHVCCLNVVV